MIRSAALKEAVSKVKSAMHTSGILTLDVPSDMLGLIRMANLAGTEIVVPEKRKRRTKSGHYKVDLDKDRGREEYRKRTEYIRGLLQVLIMDETVVDLKTFLQNPHVSILVSTNALLEKGVADMRGVVAIARIRPERNIFGPKNPDNIFQKGTKALGVIIMHDVHDSANSLLETTGTYTDKKTHQHVQNLWNLLTATTVDKVTKKVIQKECVLMVDLFKFQNVKNSKNEYGREEIPYRSAFARNFFASVLLHEIKRKENNDFKFFAIICFSNSSDSVEEFMESLGFINITSYVKRPEFEGFDAWVLVSFTTELPLALDDEILNKFSGFVDNALEMYPTDSEFTTNFDTVCPSTSTPGSKKCD